MLLEEFGDQNGKTALLNFWCNSADKGANEIFACFKREIKNRSRRSSLYKALLRPVKKVQIQCLCVQKSTEKSRCVEKTHRNYSKAEGNVLR